MTISCDQYGDDNIARLNAFLDRFDDTIDPDFDDADELDRQFREFHPSYSRK